MSGEDKAGDLRPARGKAGDTEAKRASANAPQDDEDIAAAASGKAINKVLDEAAGREEGQSGPDPDDDNPVELVQALTKVLSLLVPSTLPELEKKAPDGVAKRILRIPRYVLAGTTTNKPEDDPLMKLLSKLADYHSHELSHVGATGKDLGTVQVASDSSRSEFLCILVGLLPRRGACTEIRESILKRLPTTRAAYQMYIGTRWVREQLVSDGGLRGTPKGHTIYGVTYQLLERWIPQSQRNVLRGYSVVNCYDAAHASDFTANPKRCHEFEGDVLKTALVSRLGDSMQIVSQLTAPAIQGKRQELPARPAKGGKAKGKGKGKAEPVQKTTTVQKFATLSDISLPRATMQVLAKEEFLGSNEAVVELLAKINSQIDEVRKYIKNQRQAAIEAAPGQSLPGIAKSLTELMAREWYIRHVTHRLTGRTRANLVAAVEGSFEDRSIMPKAGEKRKLKVNFKDTVAILKQMQDRLSKFWSTDCKDQVNDIHLMADAKLKLAELPQLLGLFTHGDQELEIELVGGPADEPTAADEEQP